MTKEDFENIIWQYCDHSKKVIPSAKECFELAQSHTKQQAIQFARYLDSVDASPRANDKWFVPKKIAPLNIADYNSQFIPTEELYNKFLEQK